MKSSSNTNLLTAIGVKRSRTVDKNISNSTTTTTNTNNTKSSTRDNKSRTRRVQSISISTPLTNKPSAAKSSSTNTNTNKKQNNNNNNDVFVVDMTNIDSSSPATMAQNRSQRALSHMLCWEGPPAHFMLPTHAIHCRSSRSVERCPRACKGTSTNPPQISPSLSILYSIPFIHQ